MTATTSSIEDIVAEFRVQCYALCKWFTPYAYALTPVERRGIGTMAVDISGRMYYDPEYVAKLTVEQGAYVVLHEAMHLMLAHHQRFQRAMGERIPTQRERFAWNIAGDIAIWIVLEQIAQHEPNDGGVTFANAQAKWPTITREMSVEEYYSVIMACEQEADDDEPEDDDAGDGGLDGDKQQNNRGSDGTESQPSGGDDDSSEDSEGTGPDGDSTASNGGTGGNDSVPSNNQGQPGTDGATGDRSGKRLAAQYPSALVGGSSADGIARDYELPADPAWDAFIETRAMQKVEELVEDHERQCGTIPGHFSDIIKARLRPAPDPWKILATIVGTEVSHSRATPTPTYHVRNRRQVDGGALLKGYRYHQPKVVCVIDTSGSMTRSCKEKCVNAVMQGTRGFGKLLCVFGDMEVRSEVFATNVTKELDFVGGGGTDMTELIRYVEEKHAPTAIVCCTDGGTGWPEEMKARLVVALTDESMRRCCPPYARVVHIPNTK